VFQYWIVTFPLDGLQAGADALELDVPGDEQAAIARAATIAVVAASPRVRAFFPLMLKRSLSNRTLAPSRGVRSPLTMFREVPPDGLVARVQKLSKNIFTLLVIGP
jgi:hypothetical protein